MVTGDLDDGRLVGRVEATTESVQLEVPPGPRKVAVILVKFAGDPEVPWSLEQSRGEVFTNSNSASAFYEEESHDRITLTGDGRADGVVFGWYSLGAAAVCPYEAVAVRPSARTDAKTLREKKKRFEDIAILKMVRATVGSVLLQVPEDGTA